ncbi:MAG TPA: CvpA family protein [Pirellulaceae bacterium]|nr:CvpA family protein [Pirellulaceae bacterium]HMO92943.1 CvpA family protein [Pirellulaceae bacterium]HMP68492.1 CvpA family protein [Pirellulaceae bacterium]
MVILIIILSFLLIVGATWWMGLWSNVLTLAMVFIAAMVASTAFETTANTIEEFDPTYTYVADFLGAWLLFFVTFGVLRLLAELMSKHKLTFDPATDYIGRSVVSLATAWIFVCFASFTLHMAPAPAELFSGGPQDKILLVGPDRLWLRFMHSRSKGALADAKNTPFFPEYTETPHPDDGDLDARVFDPWADFVFKYRHRREKWSNEEQLRVYRQP